MLTGGVTLSREASSHSGFFIGLSRPSQRVHFLDEGLVCFKALINKNRSYEAFFTTFLLKLLLL